MTEQTLTNTSALVFVERGTATWQEMWEKLSLLALNQGDKICLNEKVDACWEYMGSRDIGSNNETHYFKHDSHPTTGKREIAILVPDVSRACSSNYIGVDSEPILEFLNFDIGKLYSLKQI